MKMLTLLALLIGSMTGSMAMAQTDLGPTEVLKGYVNLDRRGVEYFVAVDTKTWSLTATLPLRRMFDETATDLMYDCMDKKTTHVILIDQVPAVQTGVPTGIPGRTTTTHFPRYENIRCVPADGFIETWREIVKVSSFR